MSVKVSVDQSVNAAYIQLSDHEVAQTERLGGGILVDLDDMRVVVGIEVLSLEAQLPLTRLREEFHVHSSVVDLLDRLRPTIGYQMRRFQQASEGTSARTEQRVEAFA